MDTLEYPVRRQRAPSDTVTTFLDGKEHVLYLLGSAMTIWRPTCLALALLALPAAGAYAQPAEDTDLRQEIEALKRGQAEIQKQLGEIRQLLAARPAAPAAPARPQVQGKMFDLADNVPQGEPSARLTLVDFTDYQ